MNFYYRSLSNGRCEVVCTRCFLTVGEAWSSEHIRLIEDSHTCLARRSSVCRPELRESKCPQPAAQAHAASSPFDVRSKSRLARNVSLLCVAAGLFYVLPTIFEWSALHTWNPWIAVVIPGDFLGCLCLTIVFRKIRLGICLYGLLTAAESLLYWLQIMPPSVLLWIADVVPTLVIFTLLSGEAGRHQNSFRRLRVFSKIL